MLYLFFLPSRLYRLIQMLYICVCVWGGVYFVSMRVCCVCLCVCAVCLCVCELSVNSRWSALEGLIKMTLSARVGKTSTTLFWLFHRKSNYWAIKSSSTALHPQRHRGVVCVRVCMCVCVCVCVCVPQYEDVNSNTLWIGQYRVSAVLTLCQCCSNVMLVLY